jgi:hypothetical protein
VLEKNLSGAQSYFALKTAAWSEKEILALTLLPTILTPH